jgi:predicted deacylase
MHDCKCDSEGLYNQFKIQIQNIFDTQSAHVVVKKKATGGECTHADKNVGIDVVCSEYGGAPNPFKDKIKVISESKY